MRRKYCLSVYALIIVVFLVNLTSLFITAKEIEGKQVSDNSVEETIDGEDMDEEVSISENEVAENQDEETNIDYSQLKINYKADYSQVIYGSDDGIKSIEINAIAQTPDGYIYVGSYAGLYRYNGSTFKSINIDSEIANVTCMYVDGLGRLWIGTNDKGIFVYDPKTTEVLRYTANDGLASNSIRCITEDKKGVFYIGTSSYLCSIEHDNVIKNYSDYSNITFVKEIISSYEGVVYGVTNEGGLFAISDGKLVNGEYFTSKDFACNSLDQLGNKILVGTVTGEIVAFDKNNIANYEIYLRTEEIGGLNNINKIKCDDNGGYFIGADNGLGYCDVNRFYQNMQSDLFQGAASDILLDYQGNVWFSSSKYGVCKYASNSFADIFKMVGIDSTPVNGVTGRGDLIYVATDGGLIVINEKERKIVEDPSIAFLSDMRIRDAYKDSKSNIWLSVYDAEGIVKLEPDGTVVKLGEEEGALGNKFRSSIELPDGTIAEASNKGITLIKDDKIVGTVGEKEGMIVTQILCMQIDNQGRLLAGSDGDGIYVIEDGKIVDHISVDDGLDALVVLRIVKAKDGFIYVGSDGLYYDDGETVSKLTSFPYTNNYDLYITDEGEAWVSGSGGFFVVGVDDLVTNGQYDYVLIDKFNGFDTTLVANSWNYVDENGNFYICCSSGVKKYNIQESKDTNNDYNVFIDNIGIDDEINVLPVGVDRIVIPAGTNRVSLLPAVLNYSMSNPLIKVSLTGFDDKGVIMKQSELNDISFTNIPNGEYVLNIQILDEVNRAVLREIQIPVIKEAEFYETGIFKAYMYFVIGAFLFFTAWLLAKYGSVNELKYQYNETRKARDEAENANQAKSQFLAKMSHEIRTPINAILGMDDLLMQEDISETVYGYASDIKNATTALLTMVNDVLDFSKMESQKMHLVEQEYNARQLMENVVAILVATAKSKNLKPIITIDPAIPSKLFGDEGRIRQILLNLLSNATKYTREGSVELSVSVENSEGEYVFIKFMVKDTGIGIKTEDLPKLFNSFERVDEESNANIQGTGLGLAITKELANLMESDIKVESEYGKGTTFYFVLKQRKMSVDSIGIINTEHLPENNEKRNFITTNKEENKTENKGISEKKKRKALFTAKGARILVVDDNSINRKVVKGILKGTECTIDLAESGQQCIKLAKENNYHVILLDHMMPEMDGIETLKMLREDPDIDDIPIIALTANATEGARELYMGYGFTDYITKPVNADDLEQLLIKYLPTILVNKNDREN